MNNRQWIVDDGLALVLKVSRMFGTAPVRFEKQSGNIVKFSRPYFIYGILVGLTLGAQVFESVNYVIGVQSILYKSEDVLRFKSNGTAFDVSFFNTSMLQCCKTTFLILFIISTTLFNKIRLGKLLCCYSSISQIKKEMFYRKIKQLSGFSKWQIALMLFGLEIFLCLIIYLNPQLNITGTIYIDIYLVITSMSIWITTAIQFAVVAQYANSAFGNINNTLEAIMCDLSEPFSNERARNPVFCLEDSNCDLYIPISSINRAIDLIGNVEEMYPNINTRLAKFATVIDKLCSAFEKTSDVVRNMNNIESNNFVFYIIIFFSHLTWNTIKVIDITQSDEDVFKNLYFEALWIILTLLNLLPIIEVCHHTRQTVARTRVLLGKVMTISSKSPLMADAADAFFSRLILGDVSYSIFNMCHLDRRIFYSITGCFTTLIVLFISLS